MWLFPRRDETCRVAVPHDMRQGAQHVRAREKVEGRADVWARAHAANRSEPLTNLPTEKFPAGPVA